MGPVGFEPTTASAPGQYFDEINQIDRVGILDQARRWPLRLKTNGELFKCSIMLLSQ